MSAQDIIREKAEEAGWDDDFLIVVLCRYIDNQQDDESFEDFLDRAVEEEKEFTVTYAIHPGRAADVEFDDDGWLITKSSGAYVETVAFVQTETMARLYVHANGQRLPDDPEERGAHRGDDLSNEQRAVNAAAALLAYCRQRNRSHITAEDELEDLVADILHLCAKRTIPPPRVLRRAIRDYERERGESIVSAILTPE